MDGSHTSADGTRAAAAWRRYFENLPIEFAQFQTEAADYVARLATEVSFHPHMRVLDYGCGPGFAASLVAQHVAVVALWDTAARLRASALEQVSRFGHAEVVDLSTPSSAAVARFDLILVNSVVQYMTENELGQTMRVWRRLLRPEGRVILSDVVPPDSRMLREIRDTLWFSLSRGIFFASLNAMRREFLRYAVARRSTPLLRLTASSVAALARNAGLMCTPLRTNLTFRRNRLSFPLAHRVGT
jgi:cyclopropane fatty-acyl-phospholipid synthase-like methyltransferase